MPWKPVNEARIDEGRPPLGDPNDENNPYNKLMANTPLGVVTVDDVLTAKEVATPPPAPATGQSNPGSKTKSVDALLEGIAGTEGQVARMLEDETPAS
jgi:hypothetical protein